MLRDIGHYVEVVVVTLHEGALRVLTTTPGSPPHTQDWTPPAEYVTDTSEDIEVARRILASKFGLSISRLRQGGFQSSRYLKNSQIERYGPFLVICGFISYSKVCEAIDASINVRIEKLDEVSKRMSAPYRSISFGMRSAIYNIQNITRNESMDGVLDFFSVIEENFTLSELQSAVEAIRDASVDKRNFRRDILAGGLVEETGDFRRGRNRPAALYRLSPQFLASAKE